MEKATVSGILWQAIRMRSWVRMNPNQGLGCEPWVWLREWLDTRQPLGQPGEFRGKFITALVAYAQHKEVNADNLLNELKQIIEEEVSANV